jgi:hypothetical protein
VVVDVRQLSNCVGAAECVPWNCAGGRLTFLRGTGTLLSASEARCKVSVACAMEGMKLHSNEGQGVYVVAVKLAHGTSSNICIPKSVTADATPS